jgi:hypothetical protein
VTEPTTKRYMFHGVFCEVYTTPETLRYYSAFPWRFRLIVPSEDRTIHFVGVQNYCETARSAMMRAKARCRRIADGTYSERYSTPTTFKEKGE